MNLKLIESIPQRYNGKYVYHMGDIFIIDKEPYVLSLIDNYRAHLVCLYDGLRWGVEPMEALPNRNNGRMCVLEEDINQYTLGLGQEDWYYYGEFFRKDIDLEEMGLL